MSTGAQFGLTRIEVGMKLEDDAFENWKDWAIGESVKRQQSASDTYHDINHTDATTSSAGRSETDAVEEAT